MSKIIKKIGKAGGRAGQLRTRRGVLKTPFFMPIATRGAVKNLTPEELRELGAEIILGNTYHLWLRPGLEVIKRSGGLHEFMHWDGPILTDSGGFQVFSLGGRAGKARGQNFSSVELAPQDAGLKQSSCEKFVPVPFSSHVRITDAGVEFRDPADGKKYFLTPEKAIEIQLALGSDIIMVLDECPAYPATRKEAEQAVVRTTRWAERCKKYFAAQIKKLKIKSKKPLLFGIIQGGIYKDLRQRSANELLRIGFDGYAIGGVAVGEPRKYLAKVLGWVLPLLPQDKPRYLMGLGKPEEIVRAVLSGIDMFDCVIPTREARHGRIYKFQIPKNKIQTNFKFQTRKAKFYETLQIMNSKFAKDMRALDENCSCYACQNYSRAYINHLFKIKENLGLRLATMHNLRFYLDLMTRLRD
ncbi:MAG: tRNA guanosine(34) transglycosylase Tgt [bacterium]